MPSIADFPDEPKYSIKNVCTQTGIRPVTLRAWERRYEVLTPFRSENRYRLYSERDIAILHWVKNRVEKGEAISQVANELRAMEKNGLWADVKPKVSQAKPVKTFQAQPVNEYVRKLYQALIRRNEVQAGELLYEAHSAYDLKTVLVSIITPCLVEIGEAWYRGEIRVATEHFASAYLRGKLFTLFQSYPVRRNATYLMVGCAPAEQHEIGSLILAILLRARGYRVEFLGADIPIDDLVDYVIYEKPRMVILSATMEFAALELQTAQEQFDKLANPPIFAYGGRIFKIKPSLLQEVPGIYLGDNLELVLVNVDEICGRASRPAQK
jgi:MerR family transcriptional regulator, light-induced transcriptional regulator